MLGFQPLSTFAISDFDLTQADDAVVKIADIPANVSVLQVYTIEIYPFQPGVEIVVVDDDVAVEVSWVQFEVPS